MSGIFIAGVFWFARRLLCPSALEEYKEFDGGFRALLQQAPDALDQVQFSSERDLSVALLNHEAALLENLRAALRHLEEGSYGICVVCDEAISAKRLAAVLVLRFLVSILVMCEAPIVLTALLNAQARQN